MKKTIPFVCALLVLGPALPAFAADDATSHFTKALKEGCQPWMEGAERKTLSAKLQSDSWNAIDNAIFSKSGAWGSVTVALQQPSGETKPADGNWLKTWVEQTHGTGQPPAAVKRECQIQLTINQAPWSTAPAVTAAGSWIATAFPKAEKKHAAATDLDGQTADGTVWTGGNVKITQIAFQSKQSSPNSDVLLKVENE
jgi:hypothetical protein